jgi:hypothetical protein
MISILDKKLNFGAAVIKEPFDAEIGGSNPAGHIHFYPFFIFFLQKFSRNKKLVCIFFKKNLAKIKIFLRIYFF